MIWHKDHDKIKEIDDMRALDLKWVKCKNCHFKGWIGLKDKKCICCNGPIKILNPYAGLNL